MPPLLLALPSPSPMPPPPFKPKADPMPLPIAYGAPKAPQGPLGPLPKARAPTLSTGPLRSPARKLLILKALREAMTPGHGRGARKLLILLKLWVLFKNCAVGRSRRR
jgi:hypothetical protein